MINTSQEVFVMAYKDVKKWRHETKKRLVKAFGGKCGIYGYNKCIKALVFHHLNPDEKKYNFESVCRSWEKTVKEVRKCVMLCCNCHSEVHAGITKIPDNIKRFDESFSEYKNTNLVDKCPACGKMKPISQKTCSRKCAGSLQQRVDWDKIDLLEMYKEIGTYLGVSDELGVSDVTVRKRILKLKKHAAIA